MRITLPDCSSFASSPGSPRDIETGASGSGEGVDVNRLASDGVGCVRSLVRALGILNELSSSGGLTLSDVAERLRLPCSTAHRLLCTMQALKYVRFDRKTMRWSVGIQVFNIGSAFAPPAEQAATPRLK